MADLLMEKMCEEYGELGYGYNESSMRAREALTVISKIYGDSIKKSDLP